MDVLLRGGTVIDGTGRPRFTADIGVEAGRIVSIGHRHGPVRRTIDASGLVVAPGFIDVHTHYDAQVFWDPALTPSTLHGVTTVIGGNCGFSLAPIGEEDVDYIVRMLARVEGMPLESLQCALPDEDWRRFGDWLSALEGRLAINAGFLVGHSTIRRRVLGEGCHDTIVAPSALVAMEALVHDALAAGALGFSSSNGAAHFDGAGDPVPSRCAGDEELVRLAGAVGAHPGTTVEYIPSNAVADASRMAALSVASQRAVNWNVLIVSAARSDAVVAELGASDRAAEQGGTVVALTNPAPLAHRRSFFTGATLEAIPGWAPIFRLPPDERILALSSADVRARLRSGAAEADDRFAEVVDFGGYTVEEVFDSRNRRWQGHTIRDRAADLAVEPFDALLDLVIEDGLRTTLLQRETGGDEASWRLRGATWLDDRVVLGASDAGAHLDMIATFTYTTDLIGPSTRDRGLVSLEDAIHMITGRPAALYGLIGRGQIAEGARADLVVFDPATVGPRPVITKADLPAGASRLFAAAFGIEHTFVNGVEVLRGGQLTGARPGRILRAGRDTETPVSSRLRRTSTTGSSGDGAGPLGAASA